jgi:hypothetical protein
MSSEPRVVKPLDILNDSDVPPCSHCSKRAWIVDGDGFGKWWLLCILHDYPIITASLPDSVSVEKRESE